jgi:hypothetical protein
VLIVGGMIPSVIAFIAMIDSIAPAAPNKWPVIDLVALTEKLSLSPNTAFIALASLKSPTDVEVAWAFT